MANLRVRERSFGLLVVLTLACGLIECAPDRGREEPNDQPPAGFTLSYQNDFATSVSGVFSLSDHSLLVVGHSRPSIEDKFTGFTEHLGRDGSALFSVRSTPGGMFAAVVAHPSGEFSAIELQPDAENKTFYYPAKMHRLDNKGHSLRTALFPNEVFSEAGKCKLGKNPVFLDPQMITAQAMGDDLIISAFSCYQHVIMRLGPEYQIVWAKAVTPALSTLGFYGYTYLTDKDEQGNIRVAVELDAPSAEATAKALGLAPFTAAAPHFLLVVKPNLTTGSFEEATFIPMGEGEHVDSVQIHGNTIYLIGMTAKPNPSGRSSQQNELMVKAITRSNGVEIWSRSYSFKNEHLPRVSRLTRDGDLLIGGCFGHVVVDTGSWVEFPSGFVGLIGTQDGAMLGSAALSSERRTCVLGMALEHDQVIFSGELGGPITHTADHDAALGYSQGFIRTITLDTLKKSMIEGRI